ncbi:MAG: hypothetical protein J5I94_15790 [Phaeodactylibacter sp.]|nr:hypothetical protein [Phaeodactylibacter sp.]
MDDRPYLTGLGWVNDAPRGNRLRWYIEPNENIVGVYRGLPTEVRVLRSVWNEDIYPDTQTLKRPSGSFPINWWNPDLGDIRTSDGIPSQFELPVSAQAVRFFYQGPATLIQAYDSTGSLFYQRRITENEFVLLEHFDIREIRLYSGPAFLNSFQYLDLFAGHDEDVDYEQIAAIPIQRTTTFPYEEAYQRYTGSPNMDEEEWDSFQEEIVQVALDSSPASDLEDPGTASPWTQFQSVLALRWEFSQLYGFGFLDGPETPPGSTFDHIIRDRILTERPTRPHIYKISVAYSDPDIVRFSNPVVILPLDALPVEIPIYQYLKSTVKLYGEDTYNQRYQLSFTVFDYRVIGFEVEETFLSSPILDNPTLEESYFLRSWRPTDQHEQSTFERSVDVDFYDIGMRLRARSIDGWDRFSPFNILTDIEFPIFRHNPEPPPPLTAWRNGDEVTIVANNEEQSFRTWEFDHAVLNTPNSQLLVLRKDAQPAIVKYNTFYLPEPYINEDLFAAERFSLRIPATISSPHRFVGGYLIAGNLRTTIDRIENNAFIFAAIADGAQQSAFFNAGDEVILQQSPDSPALFIEVAAFPINDLPELLIFEDVLPTPSENSTVDDYALRIHMGILEGGLSNLVSVLRMPDNPEIPPQFQVDFLGVDFYDRTLVRVTLAEPRPEGEYTLYWSPGAQSLESFQETAIKGDYGAQEAHNGIYIYEIFSLPVPKRINMIVTFGLLSENKGGFKSGFRLLPTPYEIAPYAP